MKRKFQCRRLLPAIALFLASGCGSQDAVKASNADAVSSNAVAADFAWPASLAPFGDGYPEKGAPCRQLGESAATSDHLDDSAILIGCPGGREGQAARAISTGRVVGEIDGVALVSVPTKAATAAGPSAGTAAQAGNTSGDALVPGTSFNATGQLLCARRAGQPSAQCSFGVVRRKDGSAAVTVFWTGGGIFWPGAGSRTIFFDVSGKAIGADVNQSDGSAGAKFTVTRKSDLSFVSIGDERYEIPDAVVTGG